MRKPVSAQEEFELNDREDEHEHEEKQRFIVAGHSNWFFLYVIAIEVIIYAAQTHFTGMC